MIGQTLRYCRRYLDRAVNLGEIVERDAQGDRKLVIFPFLAVGIGEPGETADLHSQRLLLRSIWLVQARS